MKKIIQMKKNDIFSNWKYKSFLVLLLFALCLAFFTSRITSYFADQGPDINETLQEYLTDSFGSNINNLYLYDIDKPMEDFMNASAVTSFFFCSEQYPPTEELITYLKTNLSALAKDNEFITAATVYASSCNTFISSKSDKIDDTELEKLLDKMIYNYNSNSLDKNKVSANGFNTFLFKYQDYVVFSKDLTTLSGSSYSTMFFLMDADAFSSFIYKANEMIPYKVSIYDAHNSLLFSNSEKSKESVYAKLLNYTTNGSSEKPGDFEFIYCKSDITGMQYLLEMELIPLPGETKDFPLLYSTVTVAGVMLTILFFFLLCFAFQKPLKKIQGAMTRLEIKNPSSFAALSNTMDQKVSELLTENTTLKEIIHVTSSEAVSNLFAKIICGKTVEKEETEITLNNTGYGFQLDDIYIAGILHQTRAEFITSASRERVINMLSSIFEKFKEKKQCNLCAFLFDEKSFVIIASFPAGTSIAKGKTQINELTDQINEGISFLDLPMSVAFGHMYNSILDLSFSYNEAFKTMHYQAEAEASVTVSSIASLHHVFPSAAPSAEQQYSKEAMAETSEDGATPSEQIERRAAQIAQLIWDGHEDRLPSLISRTISTIFDDKKTQQEKKELIKQLISAVTSHMLSYPFVNDSHLSNVLDDLPLQDDITTQEQQENLQKALDTLCQDFSDTLKKLRNPYIVAAQEYIEENYSNPYLSLEEIAESLKIAPNYLSTIFSKNLGIKLFEYINEYRLEKSIHLLLNTNKTVNEISTECGFGSSRNLIRIFKKYKDNTPGAYRKQHHGQT